MYLAAGTYHKGLKKTVFTHLCHRPLSKSLSWGWVRSCKAGRSHAESQELFCTGQWAAAKDETAQWNNHCRENSESNSNRWLKKATHTQKGTCQDTTEQLAATVPKWESLQVTPDKFIQSRCSQLKVSSQLRGESHQQKGLGTFNLWAEVVHCRSFLTGRC